MSQAGSRLSHTYPNTQAKLWATIVIALISVSVAALGQGRGGERLGLREKKLFPADPAAGSRFGYSAGVSGETMVIGAFIADGIVSNAGAAYVFEKRNGTWHQVAKLFADDGSNGDGFGTSAGISGDTIVIGSPFAPVEGVPGAGAAYVFHRQGGRWVQQAKLPSPDPREFGDFGDDLGVAISGDTIVVADGGAFQAPRTFGAVSVYNRIGSSWMQTARLTVENEPSFASSVSIDKNTLVVGASTGNSGEVSFSGAAYVFQRDDGQWIQRARLTAEDAASGAGLGFSVAVSGNLVAVGAINGQNAGHFPGAVYIFGRDDSAWRQLTKLVASDGADFDVLGFRIAISGKTVLAGAENRAEGSNPSVGAAYVFRERQGSWEEAAELTPSDGTASELFGCSTAIDNKTLIVGAGGQTTAAGQAAGEAYTYHLDEDNR